MYIPLLYNEFLDEGLIIFVDLDTFKERIEFFLKKYNIINNKEEYDINLTVDLSKININRIILLSKLEVLINNLGYCIGSYNING